jgi:putative nucleotidyltransferase with HDIG domain
VLALAVYVRDRRNPANRTFAALVLTSVLWLLLAFLSDQPQFEAQALLLNRLTLCASMLMGVLLVWFALVFPSGRKRIGRWWSAFLLSGVVIAVATAITPLVVGSVTVQTYGTAIQPGTGFAVYAGWVLGGMIALIVMLGGKYRLARGREHAQLKYLFLGIGLFTVFSVLFGLLLPTLTGTYAWAALNTFTPLFLTGFATYAMIRHRLMDMQVVVLRGMVYTILVAGLAVGYLLIAQLIRVQLFALFGLSGDMAFVLVGVAAVLAFQPLRLKLENLTDHIFYRRRYDQQTLLERLSEQLLGTADHAKIADAVSEVLAEQLKAGTIVLVHEEAGALVCYGEGIDCADPNLSEMIDASPDGRPVLTEELDEESRTAILLIQRSIHVVVPLVRDEGCRAAILLGEKRSGEVYTEQDLRFLQVLSPEIAIALRTAELFEQREQRVQELTALNTLASVFGQDIQLEALLERALKQAIAVAAAGSGSIMLLDPATKLLTIRASQGLDPEVVRDTKLALGEQIAGWVAQNQTSLLLPGETPSPFSDELERGRVRSALCIPLVSKERVIGVLSLNRSKYSPTFTQQNLSVVSSFAAQLAVAIENAQLYSDLEGHVLGTITALAAAVEAKDPYTFGHSSEVTSGALAIAKEMGIDAEQTEILRKAAILHDIGKIGVDGSILNKAGRLTAEEFTHIRRHPAIAANILSSLDFLHDVVPLVLHHHERYDGGGYPAGIAREAIPLGARIICVADAYDAMTSNRPYRPGMPRDMALVELTKNAGTQFDPDVVVAYVRVLEGGSNLRVAGEPDASREARGA